MAGCSSFTVSFVSLCTIVVLALVVGRGVVAVVLLLVVVAAAAVVVGSTWIGLNEVVKSSICFCRSVWQGEHYMLVWFVKAVFIQKVLVAQASWYPLWITALESGWINWNHTILQLGLQDVALFSLCMAVSVSLDRWTSVRSPLSQSHLNSFWHFYSKHVHLLHKLVESTKQWSVQNTAHTILMIYPGTSTIYYYSWWVWCHMSVDIDWCSDTIF